MANHIFEETNSNSSELNDTIVDSLPIPVFSRFGDGKIIECNKAFAWIIGKSKEELIGKTTDEIMPFKQADVLSIRDNEIYETGIDQFYETTMKYANGDIRNVIVNKSALKTNDFGSRGILCSIIDITERKRLETKLEESEAEKLISATMLQKIRAGIVIVNSDLKIIDSNLGFARLVGEENEELFETIPGLKGADLDMLVPQVMVDMFRSIFETGESRIDRDIKYQNKLLAIEIATIHKNKIAGALIRDLSAPMLERAEIIERARQVNRKNMKTVQQIAYLLGENAAQTEELLNSIIESQKYSVDEEK
ncbi:MAG TPA: PAS domain S-box protein [Prolixibacteraceae bacterium]|nr:PAS domain S-box protein [Prolixibacteraceae bacterium]